MKSIANDASLADRVAAINRITPLCSFGLDKNGNIVRWVSPYPRPTEEEIINGIAKVHNQEKAEALVETVNPSPENRTELIDGARFENGWYERYNSLPVKKDGSGVKCLFFVSMPKPKVGEIWTVTSEIHVTNNDLRNRDAGVACTTEVRMGSSPANDRGADLPFVRANGSFNVGVEAHHGLITRTKSIVWTQGMIDSVASWEGVYVKTYVWASSTSARSGDRLEIDVGRGFSQVLRIG